jgi:hypothetical protein
MKKLSTLFFITATAALGVVACNSGNNSSQPVNPPVSFCAANVANFSTVPTNLLAYPYNGLWGPSIANISFPQVLESCNTNATWQQSRVLAATQYWVDRKVNYCHHHVPTWYPTESLNGAVNPQAQASFESCSTSTDVMPPVPSESMIRWNYSGVGSESAVAWYNLNSGRAYPTGNYGYGADCSDYTKLVYAYAESIYFTSDVSMQAGQAANQGNLAPNMAGFIDSNTPDNLGLYSAGNLVCADGSMAPNRGIANNTSCNSHGGYISVFESTGSYNANAVTDSMLNNLQAGDLLYIAGSAYDYANHTINPTVTHVIIWTGQKIGSSSFISNSMIAPETDIDSWGYHSNECSAQWWSADNNIGNWIITDSHYQGPDYRAFTSCFYRNQVWGVRRVIQ